MEKKKIALREWHKQKEREMQRNYLNRKSEQLDKWHSISNWFFLILVIGAILVAYLTS